MVSLSDISKALFGYSALNQQLLANGRALFMITAISEFRIISEPANCTITEVLNQPGPQHWLVELSF